MKRILTILFAGISAHCFSQYVIPEKNALILDFVDKNIYKKVGDGVCEELVWGAIKSTDSSLCVQHPDSFLYLVRQDKIMPGDIVVFDSLVMRSGLRRDNHIGIVYDIIKDRLIVAEQNSVDTAVSYVMHRGELTEVATDSNVELVLIVFSWVESGRMSFYRRP